MDRYGTPAEVADAVAFLADHGAVYLRADADSRQRPVLRGFIDRSANELAIGLGRGQLP